ncbi:hypothetical protein EDD15DRAFT_2477315 [Pisolithus albus]|nr:hypothetical protein EDD15DRAFT_2477315 [Pisolithus albus]
MGSTGSGRGNFIDKLAELKAQGHHMTLGRVHGTSGNVGAWVRVAVSTRTATGGGYITTAARVFHSPYFLVGGTWRGKSIECGNVDGIHLSHKGRAYNVEVLAYTGHQGAQEPGSGQQRGPAPPASLNPSDISEHSAEDDTLPGAKPDFCLYEVVKSPKKTDFSAAELSTASNSAAILRHSIIWEEHTSVGSPSFHCQWSLVHWKSVKLGQRVVFLPNRGIVVTRWCQSSVSSFQHPAKQRLLDPQYYLPRQASRSQEPMKSTIWSSAAGAPRQSRVCQVLPQKHTTSSSRAYPELEGFMEMFQKYRSDEWRRAYGRYRKRARRG